MAVTIELAPADEQALRKRAAALGQDVETYIGRLVRQDLGAAAGPRRPNEASLDLLAQWEKEDGTDDPAEIERRRWEWEALRQNLNRNRDEAGARRVFP